MTLSAEQQRIALSEFDPPYVGIIWGENATAKETPATEEEALDTGLLDQHGNKLLRKPVRIKMGFHIGS